MRRLHRTEPATGIPDQPNVFYIGVTNGGVWKTTDYGHTWFPIFDDQPTGSVGAIALAPSNPDIIYVGSGEGLQRPDLSTGDGIYKSTDAGRTWRHLGLRDGQQIPQIAVDPGDPNRLFVAVLGHPYGPNEERGLFLSSDGGASFRKVLYRDENTGAIDVVLDPANPDIVYAVMWEARQGPWENGQFKGPAEPGGHRFLWDLKYPVPAGFTRSYPIAGVKGQTEKEPNGVWVMPGRYQARLTLGGRSYAQTFQVRLDSRVRTPAAALRQQFVLSRRIGAAAERLHARFDGTDAPPELAVLRNRLQQLYGALQEADAAPTSQLVTAVNEELAAAERLLAASGAR